MITISDTTAPQLGVVVVGAGSGTRLGGVDKAFLDLAGQPMIAHSVATFNAIGAVAAIVLVVAGNRIGEAEDVVRHGGDRKSTRLNSSHSQQSRMPSSA